MTKVVLAEKPSVARDIARVVGARKRGDGYLEGDGYIVTWALGHLVHFAEPDDYGSPWDGRWSLEPLPMIPERWKLKTDKRTVSQFRIVKKLINDARTDEVICATDAGREGENIFRLIYEHAGCKKPFHRLWISSLTDVAIREGFRRLQPGSAFDALAGAARARAQADWLVGMNLTRAYTVHNKVLCTIGRVQTPTLAMIVDREEQISSFKKVFFYELVAHLEEGFSARYSKDGQTRIEKKEEAERLHRELSPNRTGTVVKIEKRIKKQRPPPLYDLNNLQRDANRRFGFTAAQVLDHAQSLYETHKLITYPRTESRHISEDMVGQLPRILENLQHEHAPEALERLRAGLRLSKAYVDKTKLTDHHAILPTGMKPPPTLSPALKKVYDLVVARFVAIFLPDHVVEETLVTLNIGGANFIARGALVLQEGWKVVEPKRNESRQGNNPGKKEDVDGDEEDDRQTLPSLKEGQQVHVAGMEVVEKETKPPRRYSDATLLGAMKNAGRQIEDEALAEAMKESGLGTPATRAEMIEKLIRGGFIERQKKALAPTEKGKALIGAVAGPLRSPELTAEWEQQLKEIEEGQLEGERFYRAIVEFLEKLIPEVVGSPTLPPEAFAGQKKGRGKKRGQATGESLGSCPLCKQGEVCESPKAYGCSRYREGCKFAIWKTVAGKKLTPKQAGDLLTKGETTRLKGFTSKTGKPFEARLKLDGEFKVVFDFENGAKRKVPACRQAPASGEREVSTSEERKSLPSKEREPVVCPKCGQGRIIEGKRGFGCNRFREGCDFVVWKEIAGKKLTEKQIYRLIEKGKTAMIKGFKSRSGNGFQARLKLDPEWKATFEFTEKRS